MVKFCLILIHLGLCAAMTDEEWLQKYVGLIDTLTVPTSSQYSFAAVELKWFGDLSIFSDLNDFYQQIDPAYLPPFDAPFGKLLDTISSSTKEGALIQRGILQYVICWHIPKETLTSIFQSIYPDNILSVCKETCALCDVRGYVGHNRLIHFLGMDGCMFFEPHPRWLLQENECLTMQKLDSTIDELLVVMKVEQNLCTYGIRFFNRLMKRWFGV